MSSSAEQDHIALANRNHAALLYVMDRAKDFPEWVATIAFYKSVQVIEASLVYTDKRPSHDHRERLRRLKNDNRYQETFKHYRPLFEASLIARYLRNDSGGGYSAFSDFIASDQVVNQFVSHRLRRIETSLCKSPFLSKSAREALDRVE